MTKKFKIQVQKEHYFGEYDDMLRFISYFYQVDIVRKLNPNNVLEIGIGNKTTSNYLKQNGIKIDTCDFDKELKPDYVADIRELPFDNKYYDLVLACEILEHIPWADVDKALNELNRVSKKYVVISIPYSSAGFELLLKFPLLRRIIKKTFLSLFFRIPYFFMEINFKREHYWEMGRKNYSKKRIKSSLEKYFIILKEVRPILNHCHHFFILEKK
jgi:ubiquinone/menaquinone biosynthesis C-methylase UbiE